MAAIVALTVVPGARNSMPEGLPVVGRNAEDVYGQLKAAGLPVAPGRPASSDYDDLIDNNACSSSKGFVRTDTADTGWGFICVKPPAEAHERMSDAFDEVPMLVGPMFVDDGPGDVVIFGFGWPADASKTIYDAIGASGGTHLVEL